MPILQGNRSFSGLAQSHSLAAYPITKLLLKRDIFPLFWIPPGAGRCSCWFGRLLKRPKEFQSEQPLVA